MTRARLLTLVPTAAVVAAAAVLQSFPQTVGVQGVSDWLQLILVVLCALCVLRTALRESGQGRWFWLGVTGSVALWGAAQVRFMLQGSAFFDGIDTVQNVLFLSMALPLLPALALHPDAPHPTRTVAALDVAIVGILAAFVYVYIGLSFPHGTDTAAYTRWRIGAGWFVSLAIVVAFILRLRTAVAPWRPLYTAIGAAMAFWFIGDSIVTVLMFEDRYRAGLLDLPWLLPFVWIASIALRWQPSLPGRPSERLSGWKDTRYGAMNALAAVAAPSLLDFTLALGDGADLAAWRPRTVAVLVTTVAVAGLFLVRQLNVIGAFERSEGNRQALRRSSEERFTRAFHGVPLAAAILTEVDARIVDVNDRALDLLGWSRAEALGKTFETLPSEAEAVADAPVARPADGWRGRPVRLRRASGELVDVLAWWQPLSTDGERTVLVLLQDQRETRRLETQLIQAQKAEAVGRLAGAVAHDLNNLLTAIVGSTEVAREHLADSKALATDLDHVVHAADRAASLTSRLLEYGHGQAETPHAIDVGAAVRDAERTVRQLAGDAVETVLVVPRGPLQVRIEPAEFERILVNLVVNARDAMAGGGRLTIALQPETLDREAAAVLELPSERVVALVVADTGEGISPAVLNRVFEPFFTTKAVGEGSGLGLATVRETAQRFGGAVSIASTPGTGTTVTVRLPAGDEVAATAPVASATAASDAGSETVLLVEDEDAVREVVRRVLERQGYRVLEASSGPNALDVAGGWPHPIDLLLTDVIMPEMNGPQLATHLGRSRPGLRVLYASGYAADALGPMGLSTRDVALIQKPFTPAELAQRVRQALDEA